jgi:hypothetical protein
MHEPYRTLLGHFRHEVGHYYWDRLVWDRQVAGAVPATLRRRARELCRSRDVPLRAGAAGGLGKIPTSAPTPPCTLGRTGRRPGPITCTSPTASAPHWDSGWTR